VPRRPARAVGRHCSCGVSISRRPALRDRLPRPPSPAPPHERFARHASACRLETFLVAAQAGGLWQGVAFNAVDAAIAAGHFSLQAAELGLGT
jgi:hypothetical protein